MEAAMPFQDPARMYSWWWDSHICPKNSKWLQENITDMDDKIKQMIELIEEDADSFARRAEMYYKRRPELIKLVEEFYRAYRALAERYDHANGMIRQAHQTMVEAFPDQVPAMLTDATDDDAHFRTLEKSADLGEYLSSFCVVEGLCEDNQPEKKEDSSDSPKLNASVLPKLERGDSSDASILLLKRALDKLESENEVRLVQHQHNLERLSNIESEILRAHNDSRGLNERGSKAEAEVQELKEALSKLETEKEATLSQYQQCLERISNLEKSLFNVQANAREVGEEKYCQEELEVEIVKQELDMVLTEKKLFLKKISDLEVKIIEAENQVRKINDRANKAEGKVENLEQELMGKQNELRSLWTCIQEEQSRFVEAETAFQNLQHLHFQSKEKLTCLYVELENKAQILKDLEVCNLGLQDEVLKVREENESLHKLNLSSEKSMENMKNEISGLRTEVATLQQEDELRTEQKNGLHREIYRLKEELGGLNKKHGSLLEQIKSLGMKPEFLSSSVKLLKDENVKLIGVLQSEKHEKFILLEKMEAMEKHVNKIAALESFVSDSNVELDGAREKVKALEESCQLLLREMSTLISEKAGLISQLHSVTENSHKLGEKNAVLQNTINDVTVHIEGLREKAKQLECTNQLLETEKSSLSMEKESLCSRLQTTQQGLENLQRRYEALEGETSHLEKLRMGICKISREFGIDASYCCGNNDWTGQFSRILSKVKNVSNSLDFALEENQQLVLEKSVLTTLLSQLRLEAADLETEKNALCQNLWINTKQLETLENEANNLKRFYEEFGKNSKDGCGKYKNVGNQVESSYVKPKPRTRARSSAMLKKRNEADKWENEAAEPFSKLQISAVQGALLIEKVQDFQSSEKTTGTRDTEIHLLKQSVDTLEYENKGLKDQLSEYIPAIVTLRKCIESLESHFIVNEVFTKTNKEEAKGAESRISQHSQIHPSGNNDSICKSLDGLSELQDLQHRIAVIEQVVEEIEKLSDHETVERGQHVYVEQEEGWKKDAQKNSHMFPSQFSHGGTEMPKDIMLDQISGTSSNGIVRRETIEPDDRMLELWETANKTGSIDLAVGNLQKLERRKKKNLSSETAVEKAMDVVDKLEISKRDIRPRKECKKRRIQDRLDSDALKLINLQITVQDLRKKVETSMESKKGKGLEFSSVKEQLKEAEKVIMRLFDTNGKLKKKVDDGYSSSEEQYGVKLDKTESFKRRGVTDRARRASEKIKRLQLEVQRLQFLLLSIDEGKDSNGKTKITESKSRVLLRDYLYGGVRTIRGPQLKKKPHCCACVQPPTKGD